ncbi:unnamed protein product [Didymodactylos carnosus]|uniref:Uncharacterized protein n=1 Tax=Didymodactylos carnosus TaxID=1234261 RepID=A0A813WR21_9BILA|nr:unnamed protein product [Didymodactylos carnosus]CAF1052643.1 unnamed protein product [Didymodactylos carnosus]CAF3648605.1 unnamed protein product [Didymodactylos carnosus]CAF3819286.1 unnamed protein product [Didymodactylos carnosus]
MTLTKRSKGITPLDFDFILPMSSYNVDKQQISSDGVKPETIGNDDNETSPQTRTKHFSKPTKQLEDDNKFNTSLTFSNNSSNANRSKPEILRPNSPTLKRLIAVRTKLEKYIGTSAVRIVSATKREKPIDTLLPSVQLISSLVQSTRSNIIQQSKQSQSQSKIQAQLTSLKAPLDKITYENIPYGGSDVMKKCSLEIWLPKAEFSPECQSSRESTVKDGASGERSSSVTKKTKIPPIITIKSRRQSILTMTTDDDKKENQSESTKSRKQIKFTWSNNDEIESSKSNKEENKSNDQMSDKNTNDDNASLGLQRSKTEPSVMRQRLFHYDELESNGDDDIDRNKLRKTSNYSARKRTSYHRIPSSITTGTNNINDDYPNTAPSIVKNVSKQPQQTVSTSNNVTVLNELMRKYSLIKKSQYETGKTFVSSTINYKNSQPRYGHHVQPNSENNQDQVQTDLKDSTDENIHVSDTDIKRNTVADQTPIVCVKRLLVDQTSTSTKIMDSQKLIERRRSSKQILNMESSTDANRTSTAKPTIHHSLSNQRSTSASVASLNMLTGKSIIAHRNKIIDIFKSSKTKNDILKSNLPVVTDDLTKNSALIRKSMTVSVPQLLMAKSIVPVSFQRSKTLDVIRIPKSTKIIAAYKPTEEHCTVNDTKDMTENTNSHTRLDTTMNVNSEPNEMKNKENDLTEIQAQSTPAVKVTRPDSTIRTANQNSNIYGPTIPNMFQRIAPNSMNNNNIVNKITVEEPKIYSANKRPLITLRPDISDKVSSKSSSPVVQLLQYHNPITNYHSGQLANVEKVVVHLKYSSGKTWSRQGFVASPSP